MSRLMKKAPNASNTISLPSEAAEGAEYMLFKRSVAQLAFVLLGMNSDNATCK